MCPLKLLQAAVVIHTTDTLLLAVLTLLATTDQQSLGQRLALHR